MVEFIVVAVGILIPLAYAAIAVMSIQAAHFATEAAAREAARAFSSARSLGSGQQLANLAMQQAFADHGIAATPELTFSCAEFRCLSPGSVMTFDVGADIAFPLVPRWGSDQPLSIRVDSEATVIVDQYRQAG